MTLIELIALWFLGQGLPAELPPEAPGARPIPISVCEVGRG